MTDLAPATPDVVVDPNAVAITINGREVIARKGDLIIKAAENADVYIPRFCYHDRMSSVGMCRMCVCEVDTGRGPALTPTCMVTVSPGMKVFTESETTKRVQEGIIELLLANHPLDCPVCDKGGECPLQDQAFSHGPGESRFVEEKRHYEKPIAISELVFLDRERCILCDRCTRFADEVAGDPLISFTHRGNTTQVQTFPDEPFSSYFSGNTVQICPVGALTAAPYRFKARPWDLDQAMSTCTGCSVGCQIVVQSSRDDLLRYQGFDDEGINHGWLCDKGRFSFESLNSEDRLGEPVIRQGDGFVTTSWTDGLAKAAAAIKAAITTGGPSSVAVLGGARLTNEDALAWSRLASRVIGTTNVDAQLGDGLPYELLQTARATIADACEATTVILLGPDLKEELPVLYLRLRGASEKRKIRILEISATDTGMTRYAYKSVRYTPGEQAAAVRQVLADEATQLATGNVVVVVGRASLSESARFTMDALAELQAGIADLKVLPALRRGNVIGALEAGLRPGAGGLDATGIMQAAADGKIGCLVLLGADPLNDFPDAELARRALAGATSVIAIDTFLTGSSATASVILPAAAFAERGGTVTNIEHRVLETNKKVNVVGTARADWLIASDLAAQLGGDIGISSFEDAAAQVVAANAAAEATVRVFTTAGTSAPSQNGYELRLVVTRKLYDDGVAVRTSEHLAKLAPGVVLHLSPTDANRLGVTADTWLKVSNARGSLRVPAVADAGVPKGIAQLSFNQPDASAGSLIDAAALVTDVTVESA
jgi:NADH-quinone oxidoreductase subunit G